MIILFVNVTNIQMVLGKKTVSLALVYGSMRNRKCFSCVFLANSLIFTAFLGIRFYNPSLKELMFRKLSSLPKITQLVIINLGFNAGSS